MAVTYIEAIGAGFPGVEVSCIGDGSVYENIVWERGLPMPSKATLDAWIASNADAYSERKITVLAFRNRFTQVEKVTMELASLDNPSADMSVRQQAAALRVALADLAVATFVDLNRPDTITTIQNLETAGIIGPGRANEILNNPVQAIEMPRE